ncbi:MAG TPA: transposase, partial [Candidatus Acidoferrum sp.]|nr:transposase [Candidatus Acidoferrum sp.]
MVIIGVDYHPSVQQIAFVDTETGECGERRLNHSDGEAEKFYRDLRPRGISVLVGLEATGYSRWFERLLAELGIEVWIGDAAEIKTKRVRKQKTDRQDAQLLLKLLLENRFPRIWVPNPENRDLRQLLWHRHRLVQMRTRIMNQLQKRGLTICAKWDASQNQAERIMRQINARWPGNPVADGRSAYVLQATPHPGYHAHGKYGKMFSKVEGKLWVDKQDFGWIKVDGQVTQSFSMGL